MGCLGAQYAATSLSPEAVNVGMNKADFSLGGESTSLQSGPSKAGAGCMPGSEYPVLGPMLTRPAPFGQFDLVAPIYFQVGMLRGGNASGMMG